MTNPDTLKWQHTIMLPSGKIMHGVWNYTGYRGDRFMVPQHLDGKSVMDFGTWDGFWAIESLIRGASRVLAVDRWNPMLETTEYALDMWMIPYRCSGNLDEVQTIEKLTGGEMFDVVLFFGIIYHLMNPVVGVQNAARCCKPGGRVIIESAFDQGLCGKIPNDVPALWLINHTHHGDITNYVMPNFEGVVQLGRMAGLRYTGEHTRVPGRCTVIFEKPVS